MPTDLINTKPMTVTVRLPATWMAYSFVEWVTDEFTDRILANEGQHLMVAPSDDEWTITLIRDPREDEEHIDANNR